MRAPGSIRPPAAKENRRDDEWTMTTEEIDYGRQPLSNGDHVKAEIERYLPMVEMMQPPTNPNMASEFHWRLVEMVNDFHRELEDEYEVGGQLVSFGSEVTFSFTGIGYYNPSLIRFYGEKADGSPIELIQHVSQISVMLIRQRRSHPEIPKRPIGFASWSEYDKEVAERQA